MSLSAWQRWWLLVATACLGCLAAAAGDDSVAPETCSDLVAAYARDHGGHGGKDTHNKFVFFLHVPRTAGKTYATCFLRAAVPPSKRCAPSYDGLHLNVSQAGCTYIVSHDDYSIIEQLPPDAAVITQLRRPADRVVSAYEFAIEVAARKIDVNDTVFYKEANTTFVNTLNVWPWSQLVPWFRRDIRQRIALLKEEAEGPGSIHPPLWEEHYDDTRNRTYYWNPRTKESVWTKPAVNATLDPYDNNLVMPLAEWIETEVAQELIHEGSALQLLGLTNYSYWPAAGALRRCFFEDAAARAALRALAEARLRALPHVGLTERLEESVLSMAADLGHSMNATAYKTTNRNAFSYDAADFDAAATVTYNTTMGAGALVTLDVMEARRRLARLTGELRRAQTELRPLEDELQALVDKEEAWLQEQEEEKGKETGSKLLAWAKRAAAWLADTLRQFSGKQGGGDEGKEIVSPWAGNITALDERVFALQKRRDAMQADVDALTAIDVVAGVPPSRAEGPARLVLPDEEHREAAPLGATYLRCSSNATSRAANKRRAAFKNLRTPWEESFAFTSAGRRQISPATLRRIVELNEADQALWDLGDALLTQRLAEQRAAGTLEELPKPKEAPVLQQTEPVELDKAITEPEAGADEDAGGDDDAGGEEDAGGDEDASGEEGSELAEGSSLASKEEGLDGDAYEDEPPSRGTGADGSVDSEDSEEGADGASVDDESTRDEL